MYRHIQCAIITLITVDDDHDDWYLYDKDKKICCGRKLERRIPDIDCCSNEIYFKREKIHRETATRWGYLLVLHGRTYMYN